LKRREKRPSVMTLEMKYRVATELYLFPKEKENIDKTLERWKQMVIATISEFGSRLYKGKVLAPLTSVVLNGNLLVSLGFKSVLNLFACFLLVIGVIYKRGKRETQSFVRWFILFVKRKIVLIFENDV
jgi:hypothetical protein